jgi:hypothetical protein
VDFGAEPGDDIVEIDVMRSVVRRWKMGALV